MSKQLKCKEVYEVDSKYGAFYTGGTIEWHGKWFYCLNAGYVCKVCLETGKIVEEIGKTQDDIELDVILTFTSDGDKLITAHKSGLLKLWNHANEVEKQWKSIHMGPIATLCLAQDLLITGGSDGVVRVWNFNQQVCVKALKGCTGVINVLAAHNDLFYASGDDGNIIAWLQGTIHVVYNGHFSKVTALSFSTDGCHMVSAGRDKVLILWKLGIGTPVKTLPVFQTVEAMILLPLKEKFPNGAVQNDCTVIVAGDKGAVSIWDVQNSKEVYQQQNSLIACADINGSLAVTHLLRSGPLIAVVSAEHNIIVHNLKSFVIAKQFVGFSDDILDIALCGKDGTYLAVATNSKDIKLYANADMNCQILIGHTDIVLALNRAKFQQDLLASCGKDNTIRLWRISEMSQCIAVGMRHTASVSAVCFFNSANVLISGSLDKCLKLWHLADFAPTKANTEIVNMHADVTEIAHSKNINAIAVSPNDTLIASCSQDKTIKLWSEKLSILGVLKGHKRGVWCCRFSPVDQILLSASTDTTIKLWCIASFNCLKTFSGHEASVLRAEFLSNGTQILSCGADGLVKLFDLRTSECRVTLAEHDGRIWALAVTNDESSFVTAGSDSLLIRWRDVTEAKKLEKQVEAEQKVLEEQTLANYLKQDRLLTALRLALKLDKPLTVLRIIQGFIEKKENLQSAISNLQDFEKDDLLKCATKWNTNSRSSHAAQLVINILLKEMQEGIYRPAHARNVIEDNLGYTERHYRRVTNIMQELKFIEFTIKCMKPFNTTD